MCAGGAIGVAVCFSVLLTHSHNLAARGVDAPSAFTSGTAWGFWVLAALTVVAFVAALLLIRPQELAHTEPAAVT